MKMIQVYLVWSLNVSALPILQYKISLFEFPLFSCTEVCAETKRFVNKFHTHVSSFYILIPDSHLSKIVQNFYDIVSNPSFSTSTCNEALYTVISQMSHQIVH